MIKKNFLKLVFFGTTASQLSTGCYSEDIASKHNAIVNEQNEIIKTDDEKAEVSFGVFIDSTMIGNGFLIDNQTFLTNAHVASAIKYCYLSSLECKTVYIKNKNKNKTFTISAIPTKKNLYLDYATFLLPENSEVIKIKTCEKWQITEGVKVISFFENEFVESSGQLKGEQLNQKKKPSILHDASTHKSMSGSPVYSSKGNFLLGLHWGTDNLSNKAIPITLIMENLND